MQKYFVLVGTFVFLLVIGSWCWLNSNKKAGVDGIVKNTSTSSQNQEIKAVMSGSGVYNVDTTQSVLKWSGKKPLLGNYVDTGVISLVAGDLQLENGVIRSGKFTIDMNSIAGQSTGSGKGESMLTKHLMSADFFDVAQFPSSVLVLKTVEPTDISNMMYKLTGDLTIKGVTNEISFPVNIYSDGSKLYAKGSVILDRTKWNIRYGSGTFFDNLGDKVIDDNIIIDLNLVSLPKN